MVLFLNTRVEHLFMIAGRIISQSCFWWIDRNKIIHCKDLRGYYLIICRYSKHYMAQLSRWRACYVIFSRLSYNCIKNIGPALIDWKVGCESEIDMRNVLDIAL